jgi:hypothetical protein
LEVIKLIIQHVNSYPETKKWAGNLYAQVQTDEYKVSSGKNVETDVTCQIHSKPVSVKVSRLIRGNFPTAPDKIFLVEVNGNQAIEFRKMLEPKTQHYDVTGDVVALVRKGKYGCYRVREQLPDWCSAFRCVKLRAVSPVNTTRDSYKNAVGIVVHETDIAGIILAALYAKIERGRL